jgi:hypothetical protein
MTAPQPGLTRARAAFVFRCAFVLVSAIGLAANLGLLEGRFIPSQLNYYTVLSNLFCLVYFAVDLPLSGRAARGLAEPGRTTTLPRVKGAVVMAITVTFLIFNVALAPTYFFDPDYDFFTVSNLVLHYVAPVAVVIDWLVFDRKGLLRWVDPLIWLAIPAAFLLYTGLHAPFIGPIFEPEHSRYPYPFLDVDALGLARVAVNAAVAGACFAVVGYAVFGVDRLGHRLAMRASQS